jgi:hypothetical protein
MQRHVTIGLLVVTTLILVVYDLCVVLTGSSKDTISYTILSLSRQMPLLPFLLGMLVGHLLWPQEE